MRYSEAETWIMAEYMKTMKISLTLTLWQRL